MFIISAKAQVVRITLDDVKVTKGRNTQGVTLWQEREEDDFVVSIACFQETDQTQTAEHTNGVARNANGTHGSNGTNGAGQPK